MRLSILSIIGILVISIISVDYMLEEASASYLIDGIINDDTSGVPIDGVNISAYNVNTGISYCNTSYSGGYYKLDIPAGTYMFTYSRKGYFDKSIPFTIKSGESLSNMGLTSIGTGYTVSGQVDIGDGQLSDVTLHFKLQDATKEYSVSTITDVNGDYSASLLPAGQYNVFINHSSYYTIRDTLSINDNATGNNYTMTYINYVDDAVARYVYVYEYDGSRRVAPPVTAYLYDVSKGQMVSMENITTDSPIIALNGYTGNFIFMVEKEGYTTFSRYISPSELIDYTNTITLEEVQQGYVNRTYVFSDIGNMTVYENYTCRHDSVLPFVQMGDIPLLRLYVDHTYGDGDGNLNNTEAAAFEADMSDDIFYLNPLNDIEVQGISYDYISTVNFDIEGLEGDVRDTSYNDTFTVSMAFTYQASTVFPTVAYFSLTLPYSSPEYTRNTKVYFSSNYEMKDTYFSTSETLFTHNNLVDNTTFININLPFRHDSESMTFDVGFNFGVNDPPMAYIVRTDKFGYWLGTQDTYSAKDENVYFSSAQSSDTLHNGVGIVNYTWNMGDGITTKYGDRINYTFIQAGVYNVTLNLTDIFGASASTWYTLTVDATAPTSLISVDLPMENGFYIINQSYPDEITGRFNGSGSSDNIGALKSWKWEFDDGDENHNNNDVRYGAIINKYFAKVGEYTVYLNVSDAAGLTGSSSVKVRVLDKEAPTIVTVLRYDGTNIVTEGVEVALNITGSIDNVEFASIVWHFEDDNSTHSFSGATELSNAHVLKHTFQNFTERGYRVNVVATDTSGNQAEKDFLIIVLPKYTNYVSIENIIIEPYLAGNDNMATITINLKNNREVRTTGKVSITFISASNNIQIASLLFSLEAGSISTFLTHEQYFENEGTYEITARDLNGEDISNIYSVEVEFPEIEIVFEPIEKVGSDIPGFEIGYIIAGMILLVMSKRIKQIRSEP